MMAQDNLMEMVDKITWPEQFGCVGVKLAE